MIKIYLYPVTKRGSSSFVNPYINHLAKALSVHDLVLNKDNPSGRGIFDILKYLRIIEVVYLNWPEDLPEKHRGYLQSIFFIILLCYIKISGKKIVWTLHNKKSHSKRHNLVKSILFRLLLSHSDLIITHAKEGLSFIPSGSRKAYIPHPVNTSRYNYAEPDTKKEYDIIIWGSINKYKGIDDFLMFLIENKLIDKYRILIAGKVTGSELHSKLEKIQFEYNSVTLLNRYIEENELNGLISRSKLILFCYHADSVLSSGALMDSLQFNSIIIGPDVGAFKDLAEEGMIYTYKDFHELIMIIDALLEESHDNTTTYQKIREFIIHNSWNDFSDRMSKLLREMY